MVTNDSQLPEQYNNFKLVLNESFLINDWQGVDIIVAAAVAHYIPGEMLWLRFLGPSRSGKTELLRTFIGHDDVVACTAPEVDPNGIPEGVGTLRLLEEHLGPYPGHVSLLQALDRFILCCPQGPETYFRWFILENMSRETVALAPSYAPLTTDQGGSKVIVYPYPGGRG